MAEYFVLNTGAKIPSVGLGTWQIQPGVVYDSIYASIKDGYRHIDRAAAYRNQKEDLLAVALVPPAVNQVECHPVWQQEKLHKLCQLKGVHLSAYSPFGSPGSPGYSGPTILSNPIVVSVAEKL